MKIFRIITGFVVAATAVIAVNTASAGATTQHVCDVPKLKLGEQAGKNMVVNGDKITATFQVVGTDCATPVTLAVWKSPSLSGQPINDQILFGHTTGTFGPGTHTLTAQLPDCYFQADLVTGSNPTAPDGTPNYAYQNGEILTVHPLRDFKFGGDKVCVDKPEPPVVPEDPEKPQVKGKGADAPAVLPATGPTAALSIFAGVTASAGAAHAAVSKRKNR